MCGTLATVSVILDVGNSISVATGVGFLNQGVEFVHQGVEFVQKCNTQGLNSNPALHLAFLYHRHFVQQDGGLLAGAANGFFTLSPVGYGHTFLVVMTSFVFATMA